MVALAIRRPSLARASNSWSSVSRASFHGKTLCGFEGPGLWDVDAAPSTPAGGAFSGWHHENASSFICCQQVFGTSVGVKNSFSAWGGAWKLDLCHFTRWTLQDFCSCLMLVWRDLRTGMYGRGASLGGALHASPNS